MTSLHFYHNNHGNMIENPDVGWSNLLRGEGTRAEP